MNKNKFVLITLALIVLIILSLNYDSIIVSSIQNIQNSVLDQFFIGITFISSEIIIFFVLTSLFLWKDRKRKWILPLWLTMFFSAAVSYVLKITFQRQRPFEIGIVANVMVEQFSSWNYSFPSFQSMLVFSALPILSKEFPKFKYFWFVFAALVAFSRVYFGFHFLSDVLVGGLIGYAIGLLIVQAENNNQLWKRIYLNSVCILP